jgi:hypothetical protein
MPEDYRRAIELHHFEGLPFRTSGEQLGSSENAAQLLCAPAPTRPRRIGGATAGVTRWHRVMSDNSAEPKRLSMMANGGASEDQASAARPTYAVQ